MNVAIKEKAASVRVPWNEIEIPLQGYHESAIRNNKVDLSASESPAFAFAQNAFKDSSFRIEGAIDGYLALTHSKNPDDKILLQYSHGLVRMADDGTHLIYDQKPRKTAAEHLKASPFGPLHYLHYLFLFQEDLRRAWVMPCSEVEDDLWSVADEVHIAASKISPFLIDTSPGRDWICEFK